MDLNNIWVILTITLAVVGGLTLVILVIKMVMSFDNWFNLDVAFAITGGTVETKEDKQRKVDAVLADLASEMKIAFDRQEQVRETQGINTRIVARRNLAAEETKKVFWNTHALAKRNGLDVRESWKDYLPQEEQVPAEPRTRRGR